MAYFLLQFLFAFLNLWLGLMNLIEGNIGVGSFNIITMVFCLVTGSHMVKKYLDN